MCLDRASVNDIKRVFWCYNADAREACDQAKSKLLEAEARISLLETSSENAKRREIGMHGFLVE